MIAHYRNNFLECARLNIGMVTDKSYKCQYGGSDLRESSVALASHELRTIRTVSAPATGGL